MMARTLITLLTCLGLLAGSQAVCSAETINFQGQLRNSNGDRWHGPSVNLAFRIYDEAGTLIQGPIAVTSVPVTDGFVNTNFDVNFSTLDTVAKRFLTVALDDGGEMQPRIELVRVPYAVSASSVRGSGPVIVNGNAQTSAAVFGDSSTVATFSSTYLQAKLVLDGDQQSLIQGSQQTTDRFILRTNSSQTTGPTIVMYGNDYPSTKAGDIDILAGTQSANGGIRMSAYGTGGIVISTGAQGNSDIVLNTHGTGATRVDVLEITGGGDLAEPFELSSDKPLPPGTVVIIDDEHEGHLKQASEPYDRRVAGIISGAGGLNPGVTLNQQAYTSASQHVALTGQAFAFATAENGAIEPGDMLTTSSVPGCAMKATDRGRSFGAVIGKAMSSLKSGRGLVRVLVQPR